MLMFPAHLDLKLADAVLYLDPPRRVVTSQYRLQGCFPPPHGHMTQYLRPAPADGETFPETQGMLCLFPAINLRVFISPTQATSESKRKDREVSALFPK